MIKTDDIQAILADLRQQRELLGKKEANLEKRHNELEERLEKIVSMSKDEARKILLDEVQHDLTAEIAKRIKNAEEKVKLEANKKLKKSLLMP